MVDNWREVSLLGLVVSAGFGAVRAIFWALERRLPKNGGDGAGAALRLALEDSRETRALIGKVLDQIREQTASMQRVALGVEHSIRDQQAWQRHHAETIGAHLDEFRCRAPRNPRDPRR